jgi:hypothetical protein
VGYLQVETRILEKTYTLQRRLYIKNGGTKSRFTMVVEVYTRCGTCASYDVICHVFCRFFDMWAGVVFGVRERWPVRSWLGFICSSRVEDSQICEVIVFERVGRLLISGHLCVGVCDTCMEDITYGFFLVLSKHASS